MFILNIFFKSWIVLLSLPVSQCLSIKAEASRQEPLCCRPVQPSLKQACSISLLFAEGK